MIITEMKRNKQLGQIREYVRSDKSCRRRVGDSGDSLFVWRHQVMFQHPQSEEEGDLVHLRGLGGHAKKESALAQG